MLHSHCDSLNRFLQKETLQSFANSACEAGIITVELRDNPVYNAIEGQFAATLTFLDVKEDFETCCKDFLRALRSQGGPLQRFSKTLSSEWRSKVNSELRIELNLQDF